MGARKTIPCLQHWGVRGSGGRREGATVICEMLQGCDKHRDLRRLGFQIQAVFITPYCCWPEGHLFSEVVKGPYLQLPHSLAHKSLINGTYRWHLPFLCFMYPVCLNSDLSMIGFHRVNSAWCLAFNKYSTHGSYKTYDPSVVAEIIAGHLFRCSPW